MGGVTLASILVAPEAWVAWLTVLPNILRFPTGAAIANFAPAAVLADFGFGGVGTMLGYGLGVIAAVVALILAWRGRWPGAVAAGVAAVLYGSGSTWDHYLVPTLPLIIAAFPSATIPARLAIGAFIAIGVVMWIPSTAVIKDLRPVYLGVAIAASCATGGYNALQSSKFSRALAAH